MKRISINPGRVDWSGENPGIYLKHHQDDEAYCLLSLFFRVVLSPYGKGHAAIVLAAPDTAQGWPQETNFIMTDNQRMMRWIVDGWVSKMPTFVGRAGLQQMSWLDLDSVQRQPGDLKTDYREILRGSGVTLEMHWSNLGDPLPVEVTAENSATKEHEMYSVFLEAKSAAVTVNGTELPGAVQSRQFFGRTMSTAFLAFSETWVTPANQ
ncbi:MAG: hypothetical protein OES20_09510 [Gammaproteobacteria bacterium]|nr:hypothetical protein [Gammaproteobacteria bacterium]MDH3856472.1 hypothetical protein [Gammaproteobacteria bacterium]